MDPFRNGLWAAPPLYNTTITLMDLVTAAGNMTLQQIKDPAPNVTSIPRGSVLGVGVSMAGGGAGDVMRLVITAPTDATFSDNPLTLTTACRHSYWLWNTQLSPTPGVWTVRAGAVARRDDALWRRREPVPVACSGRLFPGRLDDSPPRSAPTLAQALTAR